jgi:hypothetical protein
MKTVMQWLQKNVAEAVERDEKKVNPWWNNNSSSQEE